MKSAKIIIRKDFREHIHLTTLNHNLKYKTHIELIARLDNQPPKCKSCHKVTVSETNLVKKNCQISELLRQELAQLLINRESLTHIASILAISTSTVYRKLQ